MRPRLPIELLEKFLAGNCSQEEKAIVENWYYSFEDNDDQVSGLDDAERERLRERVYDNMLNRAEFADADYSVDEPEQPVRKTRKLWYRVAAAATLLIAAATGLLIYQNQHTQNHIADAGSAQLVNITNNTGQIYKVMLPDSSSVWLNPKASIKFPKTFGANARLVSMSGECFYEVTKNPARPFIISSRSIITKVWGTSFFVRDNESSNIADVAVVTGKVSVSIKHSEKISAKLGKDEVMLYPHQKVVYLADQQVLKPEGVEDEPELQVWQRINMSFENKPLRDIIPLLNSKYHIHIKVMNEKLNHYVLNADMTGFNLPDVLEALKKSLNIDYEIKDSSIELSKTN